MRREMLIEYEQVHIRRQQHLVRYSEIIGPLREPTITVTVPSLWSPPTCVLLVFLEHHASVVQSPLTVSS